MKSLFNRQAERFVRERKRYKRWVALFLCLAVIVSSGTYTSLTQEGRATSEVPGGENGSGSENDIAVVNEDTDGADDAGNDSGEGDGDGSEGADDAGSSSAGENISGDGNDSNGENQNGTDEDDNENVSNGADGLNVENDRDNADGESTVIDDEDQGGKDKENEGSTPDLLPLKKKVYKTEHIQIDKSVQDLIAEYVSQGYFAIEYDEKVEEIEEEQTDGTEQDESRTENTGDEAQQDESRTEDTGDEAQQEESRTEDTADRTEQEESRTEDTGDEAQQEESRTENTGDEAQQNEPQTEGTANKTQQDEATDEDQPGTIISAEEIELYAEEPAQNSEEVDYYSDDKKIAEIKEGALTITLKADVEEQDALSVPEGSASVTLNLDSYALSIADQSVKNAISVHDGSFLLTGADGGKLVRADSQSVMRGILVDGDGVLTVENVEISGFDSKDPGKEYDKFNNENMIPDGGGAILVTNGSNLFIKNAKLNNNTATIGGAVCMSRSRSGLSLTNVEMTGNQSLGDGGAIYMTGSGLKSRSYFNMIGGNISGNSIIDKRSTDTRGAAICLMKYVTADIRGTAGETEEDKSGYVKINENKNAQHGGAIYMGEGALLHAEYAEFSKNIIGGSRHDSIGGGLYIDSKTIDQKDPAATLDHVDIIGNGSDGNCGGNGLFYRGSAPIKMSFCNVCDNVRKRYGGGGIYISLGCTAKLIMDNCVISNNTVYEEGGAGIIISSECEISNSTISGNVAKGNSYGAGLYQRSSYSTTIRNTTIEGNSAASGGGIYSSSSNLVMEDVTIQGNTSIYHGGGVYGNITNAKNVNIIGNQTTKAPYGGGGGGIRGGISTADGVLIEGNTVNGWGGGVHGSIGTITGKGLIMRGNTATQSGGAIFGNMTITDRVEISGNTGNSGGGVYIPGGIVTMTGGIISDNTGTWGGAVCGDGSFKMSGGEIVNNRATKFGGAFCGSGENRDRNFTLTGGIIKGNSAAEAGGAAYAGKGKSSNLIVSGNVVITENSAPKGGGIYVAENSYAVISDPASLYWNSAEEGVDVYAEAASAENARTISLPAPRNMEPEEGGDLGAAPSWYFEKKQIATTEEVRYNTENPLTEEDLLLTLQTNVNESGVVAKIGSTEYKTVQEAVDAIQRGDVTGSNRIIMVGESSRETVTIPDGVSVVLNLNGYTISGKTRGIECRGDLTIVDEKEEDQEAGTKEDSKVEGYPHAGIDPMTGKDKIGTITGRTDGDGAGILVANSGKVVMKSGRIYSSRAAGNGGGVYVKSGVFELAGGTIENCSAKSGSAVYAESNFMMTAGSIRKNNVTKGASGDNTAGLGTVYVKRPGIAYITGGEITGNSAVSGAAVYLQNGSLNMTGSENNIISVTKNTASGNGGAIYVNGENASATVGYAEISGNKTAAKMNGGGVYIKGGTLTMKQGAVLERNEAANGGGVYQEFGNLYMIGGIIRENTASEHGGGIAQTAKILKGQNLKFVLSNGQLAGNKANSKTSPAGNDLYCYYGKKTNGVYTPSDSLMRAFDMIQPEEGEGYNAWKDETRTDGKYGPLIEHYQYVTGLIYNSGNLALTATHVDADIETSGVNKVAKWTDFTYKDGLVVENSSITAKEEHDENGFPTKWEAGYDGSANNRLVRSYDNIIYTVSLTCEEEKNTGDDSDTGENTGSDTGANTGSGTGSDSEEEKTVKVWLSVDVPGVSTDIGFDAGNMKLSYVESRVEDGKEYQTLYGYWEQKVVSGSANNIEETVGIKVYGMTDGEVIEPVFTAWVEGNDDSQKQVKKADSIRVSSAPMYNVVLETNDKLEYTGYFNLDTGEEISEQAYRAMKAAGENVVYGIMTGYGVGLQLKGSEGLKGSEMPDGKPMTFDLDFGSEMLIDGMEVAGGSVPYLWAYKENDRSLEGNSANGKLFSMDWDDQDDKDKTTSYINKQDRGVPLYDSLYNGGHWNMTSQSRIKAEDSAEGEKNWPGLHLKMEVSDYDMESGALASTAGTRTISTGYIQVIYPMDEYDKDGMGLGSGEHFLSLKAESIASNFNAVGMSGETPRSIIDTTDLSNPDQVKKLEEDLADMKRFFGMDRYEKYAVQESTFVDNYKSKELGKGIFLGEGGDGWFSNDIIYKSNDFRRAGFDGINDSLRGLAATPLGTQVYITGKLEYTTGSYNTENKNSPYYNENFNNRTDEVYERNYVTSMNLLQKFDGEIFRPVETGEIINKKVLSSEIGAEIGGSKNFILQSNEEATSWSDTKSREFTVSVLYAAKKDGTGWEKKPLKLDQNGKEVSAGDYIETTDGGAADMENYHEEDLIYFKTLKELEDYFKTSEGGKGICVGILYEIRDCCVRTAHYINVGCLVETEKEFKNTGITYCTTNDARVYTTYRPLYKEYYQNWARRDANNVPIMADSPLVNQFSWLDEKYGIQNKIQAYGRGDKTPAEAYDAVLEDSAKYHNDNIEFDKAYTTNAENYPIAHKVTKDADKGYRKTEYWNGFKIASTHTSPYKGNSLLLYTLDASIGVSNTDRQDNSNKIRESYDLSQASQRTINYEVLPKLGISSAVSNYELVANGSQDVDVVITIEIPKYLSFNGGFKFTYDGYSEASEDEMLWEWTETKHETEDADGNKVIEGSTIELRTTIADIALGLPKIEYGCVIVDAGSSDPVTGGKILKTDVSIRTEYDGSRYGEQNKLADVSATATCSVITAASSNDAIWIRAEEDEFWKIKDIGDNLVYTMNYRNTTPGVQENLSLLNIMPYNGDTAGTGRYTEWRTDSNGQTAFHGGYRVEKVEIIFENGDDYNKYITSSGKLKTITGFTTEDFNRNSSNLNSEVNSKGSELEDYSQDGAVGEGKFVVTYDLSQRDLIQKATDETGMALYWLLPQITTESKVQIKVIISPKDRNGEYIKDTDGEVQQSRDTYYDDFCYWIGSGSGTPGRCTPVWERIVGRSLSGRAWLDLDQNGHYKEGSQGLQYTNDKPIGEIKVSLYTPEKEHAVEGGKERTVEMPDGSTKTYYPAANVYGRNASVSVAEDGTESPIMTDANGKYKFDEIGSGHYVVFFEKSGDGQEISGMPFGALSVTPLRNLASQSTDNNAVPYYKEGSGDGLAELEYAFIGCDEAGNGILMPELTAMSSRYTYDSVNWNCALYYITQQVQKEWRQTANEDIVNGTAVTFTQSVTGDVSGEALAEQETYTLKKKNATKVEVYKNNVLSSDDVTVTLDETNKKQTDKSVIWALPELKLQAETAVLKDDKPLPGQSQKINREFISVGETDDAGNPLKGYIVTQETLLNPETGKTTTAVVNTQVIHDITLTKRSMTGSGETDIELPGAEYTVFCDFDCKNKVKAGVSSETTGIDYGVLTIEQLRAGTYYLKETKAPTGYAVNVEKYKIEITYPDGQTWNFTEEAVEGDANAVECANNAYNIPYIRVWRYDAEDTKESSNGTDNGTLVYEGFAADEGSCELEDGDWAVKRDKTDNKPIVKNVVKVTEDGKKSCYAGGIHYEMKFTVKDACIYKLPSTGGIGIFPFAAAGTLLLMAAAWLMMRKRREEAM